MISMLLSLFLCTEPTSDPAGGQSPIPAQQYGELVRDWQEYLDWAKKEAAEATTDEARKRFSDENVKITHSIGARALQIARAYPKDPAALDSLLWVAHWGYQSESGEAWKLLTSDYVESERIGPACRDSRRDVAGNPVLVDRFLRTVMARNPHRQAKGQACFALAVFLNFRAEVIRLMASSPEDRTRWRLMLKTPENLAMYGDQAPEDLEKEAEVLCRKPVVAQS